MVEVADPGVASAAAAAVEAASAAAAAAPHPLRKGRPVVHPEELTRVRAAGPEPNTPARVVLHPPSSTQHTHRQNRASEKKRTEILVHQLVAPVVSMTNVRIILVTTFIFRTLTHADRILSLLIAFFLYSYLYIMPIAQQPFFLFCIE